MVNKPINEHLVIGCGEIGTAIAKIFQADGIDKDDVADQKSYKFLHVCIPYSNNFVEIVGEYQGKYLPDYTIVHSTVPMGTTRKVGGIHSPCRGIHPNLEEGIRTFPKFLGGEEASDVADYFRKVGIKVIIFDEPETTEILKLFDTEYYRHCIEFAHRVKKFCDKEKLNFSEVYTIPNQTYNEGYTKLGHPEYVRPVLQPIMKEIGGHCLLPNKELVKLNE